MKKSAWLSLTIILSIGLTGCALVASSAATPYTLPEQNQPIETIVDDTLLTDELYNALEKINLHEDTNDITFKTHNQFVLAVGQVEDKRNLKRLDDLLKSNTRNHLNAVTISPITNNFQDLEDTWITSKIKANLSLDSLAAVLNLQVITEKNEVYLLGNLTKTEHDQALSIVQSIDKIKKIHNLITIVEPTKTK